jgi:hypothetical protein
MTLRILLIALGCSALHAFAAGGESAASLVMERTNAFRKAQDLAPVKTSRSLGRAAVEFARYMAKTGKYGHTADGRQPVQRATAQGYDPCIVSENIAYLYRSRGYDPACLAREMVEGWQASPEHRKAMADAAVTEIGVGIAQDEKGRYFGVQMFGRPKRDAIRFTVRNEAGRQVAYRAGERRFSLPPRAERSHTVCRRLALVIDLREPFHARPADGARYVVDDRGGSLVVRSAR